MESDNNEKKMKKENKGTKSKKRIIQEAIKKIVALIVLIAMVAASAGYLISYIVNLQEFSKMFDELTNNLKISLDGYFLNLKNNPFEILTVVLDFLCVVILIYMFCNY